MAGGRVGGVRSLSPLTSATEAADSTSYRFYRRCPKAAAVVCFDEWGPLELRPIGGVAWARKSRPLRRRAPYRRLKGTEQFLGFYDVHRDCLSGVFRKHKRLPDLFDAFRRLRACYPLQASLRGHGQPAPDS